MDGLLFGGAYLLRKICVSKSIGLVSWLEVNLPFSLCFTLYLRANFQVQAPGGLYLEGFLRYWIGRLTHGGAYFRNFTVAFLRARATLKENSITADEI